MTIEYRALDFETINEDWNFYKLSNGATLKIKVILQEVFEQEGTFDTITGFPQITVRSTTVVSVSPEKAGE